MRGATITKWIILRSRQSVKSDIEAKANSFAAEALIPAEPYKKFVISGSYSSWRKIEEFAALMKVKPFIVIGRLQKDELLKWSDYTDN